MDEKTPGDVSPQTGVGQDLGRIFCDLVMKGGITSGVVYPRAISALSKTYRFRNIGGASAGAIAAAGAAAAEYYRQTHPKDPDKGFVRLDGLHKELMEKDDKTGNSRLLRLFAPSGLSRPIFNAFIGALNRNSAPGRIWAVCIGLVKSFPLSALLGLLLAALAVYATVHDIAASGWHGSAVDWLRAAGELLIAFVVSIFALAIPFAIPVVSALVRLDKALAAQHFGLVTGMSEPGASGGEPALTEWLYDLFQDLSGKTADEPLTFGDLQKLPFAETPDSPGVRLRLMTTCSSAGRPFTLPIEDYRFYFDPEELRGYLPEQAVRWMVKNSAPPRKDRVEDDRKSDEMASRFDDGGHLRRLLPMPTADDFPVILAVRMSLSFPILLSAMRFYRINLRLIPSTKPKERDDYAQYVEPVLFTDGGVCSNLPVHMFDAALPQWPTFAINLRPDLPESQAGDAFAERRVKFGERGDATRAESYRVEGTGLAGAVSFLLTLVNTMQNWRDTLQRAAPGTKDRVATVRHTESEGGLNLNMGTKAIEMMAGSGARAGQVIAASFHPPADGEPDKDGWLRQRWARFRQFLHLFERQVGVVDTAMTSAKLQPSGVDLLADPTPYVKTHYEMEDTDRRAAAAFLDEVIAAKRKLGGTQPDFEKRAPTPFGELRITPRF